MRCSRNMDEKKKIRHTHLGAAPAELDHDHHIVCSGGDEDNHHNKVACGINFCKMRERKNVCIGGIRSMSCSNLPVRVIMARQI